MIMFFFYLNQIKKKIFVYEFLLYFYIFLKLSNNPNKHNQIQSNKKNFRGNRCF